MVGYLGGPNEGVPATIALPGGVDTGGCVAASGLPPCVAATRPPAAAPPTTTAITTHFELLDLPPGSAFVCSRVVLALSPCHEVVTRIRNWPSTLLGFRLRAVAIPCVSVCTLKLSPLSPNVPLGPDAGNRNVTVAPAIDSPDSLIT